MAKIRGVIFDLDGVLVDSNRAHVRTWIEALAASGRTVTPTEVWPLIGMGSDHALPALAGISDDSPEGRQIIARRKQIMADLISDIHAFPGVGELVTHLRERGLQQVIASSGERADVEALLAVAGLKDRFDAIVCADDADHSKPDPDLVEAALARLDLPADAVMMIGDTRHDIVAARRAGVATIAFRCGGAPEATLADAVARYEGAADLLARFADSPLA